MKNIEFTDSKFELVTVSRKKKSLCMVTKNKSRIEAVIDTIIELTMNRGWKNQSTLNKMNQTKRNKK